MLGLCAKQAAGTVEWRPCLGPRAFLAVSMGVPKKSLCEPEQEAKCRPRLGHSGFSFCPPSG